MRTRSDSSRLIHNLLLAAVLVAAQWGALVHAFDHDIGTPPNQVCTTCVVASQLGFSCIDTPTAIETVPSYSVQNTKSSKSINSIHVLVARQRGPPSAL